MWDTDLNFPASKFGIAQPQGLISDYAGPLRYVNKLLKMS